ncbi:MAG: peptidoglycan editing factor PgeF [Leptolyngbyaceae cyanobacterium SM1_1_3]|nr:peptidoglycan editing factor PgeF [Leptolyngbyaceae cyanobacterium SM1_1_3]NJN01412.1 peptidoglycan editing factor PgeF [Leptolyngbyaceae cyanobacterium RM1_1_2]NJO09576.1 peptidoglycan editing factor PgeF [Leptolyngbyaceae cyanobacterium SL_1_1]
MELWTWKSWNGSAYLTCALLEPWPHGFFTAQFWPQPPESLVNALNPSASVQRVRQVHGNQLLTAADMRQSMAASLSQSQSGPPQLEWPAADGIVTREALQSAWVCSADCTPVLIGDRATGQVAAVHAGWRGTALKIVPKAVEQLQSQGSRLADLRIALGPAIAGEVYQVSTHVAAEVGATLSNPENFASPSDFVKHLQQGETPPLLKDDEPSRAKLDVRRVNVSQLEQLGIKSDQIAVSPHCTFQLPDRFFSYRRTHEKKVQWSGIVSL